jgi:diacylglycerol kinase
MGKSNKFSFKRLFKSFGYAFTGYFEIFQTEVNARIHGFISILVIIAGVFLKLSWMEWCVVSICFGSVLAAETFNTVIERLVDHLFPEIHETARSAKDLAAAAVMFTVLASIVCGLIIFAPKVLALFN